MREIVFVFIGGGIGAISRYLLAGFVHRITGPAFPYGTLTVNILGSLLIGIIVTVMDSRYLINPVIRIFITIGILGGFTTFSTFSYETIILFREGCYFNALSNIFNTLFLCLGATWAGIIIGKYI